MRIVAAMSILVLLMCQCASFEPLTWNQLEITKLKEVKDTVHKIVYDAPIFPERLQKLNGKKVQIEGYFNLIESEDYDDVYLIQKIAQFDYSAEFPMDALMEVRFVSEPEFINSKELSSAKGTLKLNAKNPLSPFYILENAVLNEELQTEQ